VSNIIVTSHKEFFHMPYYGKLETQIAKGNRICRGCNGTIPRNSKCLSETFLSDQMIRMGKTRTVYKKLSYCQHCGEKRIDFLHSLIEEKFDTIKKIKKEIRIPKKGRYAILCGTT